MEPNMINGSVYGDNVNGAPMLNLRNAHIWKRMMEVSLQAQNFLWWRMVIDKNHQIQNTKEAERNEDAKDWILSGLPEELRTQKFKHVNELWVFLVSMLEDPCSSKDEDEQTNYEEDEVIDDEGINFSLCVWKSMYIDLITKMDDLCLKNIASLKTLDEMSLELNTMLNYFNLTSSYYDSRENIFKDDANLECASYSSYEQDSISSIDDSCNDNSPCEEYAMLCLNNDPCMHDVVSKDYASLDHVDTCCRRDDSDENYIVPKHALKSFLCHEYSPHKLKCISCYHCGKNGHMSFECQIKRRVLKGTRTIWMIKGSSTNPQGPKKIWVPKFSFD